jgi:hypothetical protein
MIRKLERVRQIHGNGCFIACLAMLRGVTYEEAFKSVHPNRDPDKVDRWDDSVALRFEDAINALVMQDLKPELSKLRHLRNLRRTALLIMRWEYEPSRMHGVVFDAKTRKFLDPAWMRPDPINFYERQLDTVLYFNKPGLR